MMSFLAQMLRDDGGYEYKRSIVDTIIHIIDENADAKDTGLAHLCEFIEDCEHPALATRVLHLLGREAPRTPNPRRYIRFVYNRVILEAPQVRAAAVTALAKFGAQCTDLRPSVCVLLRRCALDTDDEVRDRATYYLHVLEDVNATQSMYNSYILGALQVSLPGLERSLQHYCAGPAALWAQPFDLRSVPVAAQAITVMETKEKPAVAEAAAPAKSREQTEKAKAGRADAIAEQLAAAGFGADKYGPLFRSSEPVELTESETEYVVHCTKHTFRQYLVLQASCRDVNYLFI
jgi:coatomer protein complex subunit gamma